MARFKNYFCPACKAEVGVMSRMRRMYKRTPVSHLYEAIGWVCARGHTELDTNPIAITAQALSARASAMVTVTKDAAL